MSIEVSITKKFPGRGGGSAFTLDNHFEAKGHLAILGASGSGKSMTLKCIAGIETPDAGRIEVNGRVLFDSQAKVNLMPRMRQAGYLFQNYALFPAMDTLHNVLAALSSKSYSKAEKKNRARAWLAKMELSGFERHKPHELSGGQQQRLALARLLASEPDFILLDEPFSALDASLREFMHFQFLEILAGYTTAVLVTHSRDEAYKLCPEILVMDAGKPLCAGSREEVFANPGTVTAARLTGCKNISPARRTGAHELYAADWELPLRLPQIVPPGITHVGIRAHDIEEAERNFSAGPNYLRPALTRYGDELFETVFLFTNAGAPSSKEIWWKVKRGAPFPALFYFPPEKLLLLRE